MQKISLPVALRMALTQHARASDIADDDELKVIVSKLDELNEKIQAIKAKALAKRAQRL
jgi:tetrahydromethanopterin S-methyltransferase subunit G